jgi:hypothetical protein
MPEYQSIFKTYNTSENIPFKMFNKRVIFPEDKSLPLYGIKFVAANTPWTILSYQIYGSINYWWILNSLNAENNMYYAQEGTSVFYIKPEYIAYIENNLK